MKRREFITLLGGAAATWPFAAHAQTKQTRRIGVLMGLVAGDPEAQSRAVAFENGLRELGWVKRRNLSIEYRWAGDGTVLRDHVAELLAIAPDLILTNSTPVTVALREQSGTVPIDCVAPGPEGSRLRRGPGRCDRVPLGRRSN